MKKAYAKPMIVFESFKMSSSIAGDCTIKAPSLDKNSCSFYLIGSMTIFVTKEAGCEYQAQDGEYDVCYHEPLTDNKLFAS